MSLMTDTTMSDDWIQRVWRDNPCKLLDNGNIRTGPVRLAFIVDKGKKHTLFELGVPMEEGKTGKFGANLIFPVGVDLTVMEDECLAALSNAAWYRPGMGGLTMPIKDPAKMPLREPGGMLKYTGFGEGQRYVIATSDNRPMVVNSRMEPITEKETVYSGQWAVATIRAFSYNKSVNKGVGFGLQSVMIVADDTSLGGVPPANPIRDFGGVQIDASVNTTNYFGEEINTGSAVDAAAKEAAARKALFG